MLRSVQQRLPSLLDDPITFAHRGARAHARRTRSRPSSWRFVSGATGLESDVWLTARRRRRARSRRRRAGATPQAPDRASSAATSCRRTSRRSPSCSTPAAPTIDLSLDLKDAAVGPAGDRRRRASTAPDMSERTWLCHPDLERPGRAAARRRRRQARRLDPAATHPARAPSAVRRRSPSAGIDGINLHHADWNGGLVTLFHRFERTAFGWDLQFEHELRAGAADGPRRRLQRPVDVMVDAYKAEIGERSADQALSAGSQPLPVRLAARTRRTRGRRGRRSWIGPSARLSDEPGRLSPITNTCPRGRRVGP